MTRILYATTVGVTARSFLRGQIQYMTNNGLEVHIASEFDAETSSWSASEGATFHHVPMKRQPDLIRDWIALWQAFGLLLRVKPDVLVYGTPKASLIFGIAGVLARIPRRIIIIHGLRSTTLRGMFQRVIASMEVLPMRLSTKILVVSPMLLGQVEIIDHKLAAKCEVILNGSANGIPVRGSQANLPLPGVEQLPPRFRLVYVGRLTKDKGVSDLLRAFVGVQEEFPESSLCLIGPDEEGLISEINTVSQWLNRVVYLGELDEARRYLAEFDCLVLPTHRDGFGYACLEAAVAGVPVVTTTTAGVVGCLIFHQRTGLVVDPGDVNGLTDAILTIFRSPEMSSKMAQDAKAIAERGFAEEDIWAFLREEYTCD